MSAADCGRCRHAGGFLEYYGKEGQAMDEKEWLSGVDAEIQNHAEQDNPQSVPVPDFPALALSWRNPMGRC